MSRNRIRVNTYRADRRIGLNITGSRKSPFLKKNTKPGQHGERKKVYSNFTIYLTELAKLKTIFCVRTGTIQKAVEKALKSPNKSGKLAEILFSRLDYLVYAAKWAKTISQARQIVSHGFILVNGKKVDRRSYSVRVGDVISLSEKWSTNAQFQQNVENTERQISAHLSVDGKTAKILSLASDDDVTYTRVSCNLNSIIEFQR